MIQTIRRILEMIRFSHTLFALPFALLAGAMAWSENLNASPPVPFRYQELLGILICMVCARSAAMAFNRITDRKIDAENPRTAGRHLPSGDLSVPSVVGFTIVASLGFIGGTLLFLPRNPIPVLASVPVLAFLFGYSYAKRFTSYSHFWLGAALMLAPIAAWVAIRPIFDWSPLLLGTAVWLWVAGFDILYACQDEEFDRNARLGSVPARFGVPHALKIAAGCHAVMLIPLALLPLVFASFGLIFGSGVALIAVLLIYEHRLVRPDDLTRVNRAFFHVNALISVGLLVLGAVDLVW
jgi:4-hydroxybenzoate polyprenyltransferase